MADESEYLEVDGRANLDFVMEPLEDEREATVSESSQPAQRSIWLQQLQKHKKDVLLIVLLSIMLPSWDVFSDLALTIRLALEGEVYYALCLLVPQLVNIGLTAVLWNRIEPTEHRHWSWILLPLQIWPQVLPIDKSYKKCKNVNLQILENA